VKNNIAMKAALALAFASGCFSFAPAARAATLTYTTTGQSELFSLGDQLGSASNYDQLIVSGVGSTPLTTGTITLNQLSFIAGINATVPADYTYSFSEMMTVSDGTHGNTENLIVPFNLSINYSDTLTIAGGQGLSFSLDGSTWDVVVNPLTIGPNPGGPPMIADLTATVTDPPATPLPGTLVLFAGGLGVISLVGYRRKKTKAVAVA
jgi:hypothetical protein